MTKCGKIRAFYAGVELEECILPLGHKGKHDAGPLEDSQLEKLQAALTEYGVHGYGCEEAEKCTCGFTQVLEELGIT